MINKDGGGGTILDFMGGRHSCYEGDIELMEGPPSTLPQGKTLLTMVTGQILVKYLVMRLHN